MSPPKVFVSYSWTSPDHAARVLTLATELRDSGVDVIIDKWDLKPGNDALAFMEKMVTDSQVTKVMLVCDRVYAEKADAREGGVGAETQIITPSTYNNQSQDKFVAVVFERDQEGRPYVPAYYRSRIYIDLSDPGSYYDNLDQLLRWIFDRPLHVKPELGPVPRFLAESGETAVLRTSTSCRRALEAIRGGRDHAAHAATDYFTCLAEQLENLRVNPNADPFDDAVVRSISSFLPYRNEAIEVFLSLSRYLDTPATPDLLHRFFEDLVPLLDRPEHVKRWKEWDFDNFRFIAHELYLYAVAALVRFERFGAAAELMSTEFYLPWNAERGRGVMASFTVLRQQMDSLAFRKARLKLNRWSLRADILKERCTSVGVEFRHITQADFVLFMRSALHYRDGWPLTRWYPETYQYVVFSPVPFEVFARSKSRRYFERAKVLLGIESTEDLVPVLEAFVGGSMWRPSLDGVPLNPQVLLGFDSIATAP